RAAGMPVILEAEVVALARFFSQYRGCGFAETEIAVVCNLVKARRAESGAIARFQLEDIATDIHQIGAAGAIAGVLAEVVVIVVAHPRGVKPLGAHRTLPLGVVTDLIALLARIAFGFQGFLFQIGAVDQIANFAEAENALILSFVDIAVAFAHPDALGKILAQGIGPLQRQALQHMLVVVNRRNAERRQFVIAAVEVVHHEAIVIALGTDIAHGGFKTKSIRDLYAAIEMQRGVLVTIVIAGCRVARAGVEAIGLEL